MKLGLKGKKALVMGSSAGIGKAIAAALIEEGAEVCLNGRDEKRLKATAKEVGAGSYVVCDLSKPGSGEELVKKAVKELGSVDILVTNTGGPSKGGFLEVDAVKWQDDFQNLWMSAVEAMKSALPSMQKQKWGRILLVTSVAAKEPLPGLTTSNGLRAGLTGLAKSISKEMAPFGITINVLLPGYTNTERLQALNLSKEFVKSNVPAGRLGEPDELAALAAFLASEKAGYITGQSIAVDGGSLNSH